MNSSLTAASCPASTASWAPRDDVPVCPSSPFGWDADGHRLPAEPQRHGMVPQNASRHARHDALGSGNPRDDRQMRRSRHQSPDLLPPRWLMRGSGNPDARPHGGGTNRCVQNATTRRRPGVAHARAPRRQSRRLNHAVVPAGTTPLHVERRARRGRAAVSDRLPVCGGHRQNLSFTYRLFRQPQFLFGTDGGLASTLRSKTGIRES